MHRTARLPRFGLRLTACAPLAVLLGAVGCAAKADLAKTRVARGEKKFAFDTAMVAHDYYLALQSKKKAAGSAFGFVQVALDLWGPFRWEVSAGLRDPDKTAGLANGFFCTELDVRGSDPLEFYALCARPISGGLQVFASTHQGNQGSTFFAGATEVDLAVEHTGTGLRFEARPSGGGAYTTVAVVAMGAQTASLLPSIGVSGVAHPAEVAFDHFALPTNGAPPGGLTTKDEAENAAWSALLATFAAEKSLEDGDAASAGTQLGQARASIEAGLVAAKQLGGKTKKKTVARLKGARTKIDKLIAKVDGGKTVDQVIDLFESLAGKLLATTAGLDKLE